MNMSMQSEVRPKQVQPLQKFQNSTETKTYQVVCAISEHYEDVCMTSVIQPKHKDMLSNIWGSRLYLEEGLWGEEEGYGHWRVSL